MNMITYKYVLEQRPVSTFAQVACSKATRITSVADSL